MSPPVDGSAGPAPRKPNYLLIFLLVGVGSCVVLMIVAASIIVPSVQRAAEVRQGQFCMRRLQNLSVGMRMYATQNDGLFPLEFKENTLPARNQRYRFQCPRTGKPYLFNPALAGVNMNTLADPDKTVILSETPEKSFKPIHGSKANVGLASGGTLAISTAKEVVWTPQKRG